MYPLGGVPFQPPVFVNASSSRYIGSFMLLGVGTVYFRSLSM